LQQVFINILSNAVKFTPLAGKITIFLRQIQNRFEIKITDTGIGIKPEFKPYVFERFRQAELSTTKRFGGMGLGLAIAKQLVELHGGSISVESAGEGQGATFKVLLPPGPPSDIRADSPAIFPKQGHLQQKVPDLGGQRILVIDDEPDARTLISRILLETKAEVETAASAKEALTSLNTQLPDILISDIGLPGIDGYELMKLIRKRPVDAGGSIPAIALTAFARPEDKSRALRAGFQMHLTKPIDWASLMAAITLLVPQAKMLAAKKGPTDDSQF
jgi:CheY-like chemotaxis protein